MGTLASAHDNAHCPGLSTDGAAQFVKRSEFAARALEDCAMTAVVRRRTLSKHRVTRVSAVGANRTSRAKTLQRWAVCAALPVAVLAFWFGVLMAMWRYPSEYDWRYMPLSNLLSPRRDSAGHLWACAGIAVSGLCGLGWSLTSARFFSHGIGGSRSSGNWMFRLG